MGVIFSFNSVSWFLSSLVFCYAVISVVLMRRRSIFPIAFAASSASIILSAWYIQQQSPPDTNLIVWLVYIFPPNRLLNVLCGLGAGYLFKKLPRPNFGPGAKIVWTGIELIVLGFFIERIIFREITQAAFGLLFPTVAGISYSANQWFENYLMCPILTIGVLFAFGFRGGYFSRLLSAKPLVSLGRVSFSLYLCHQLLFLFLSFAKEPFVAHVGEIGFACIACVLAILTAFLLFFVIQKPAQKLLMNPRHELPLAKARAQRFLQWLTKDIFEQNTPIKTINSLNALRFFGMLVVMLHHIDFLLGWQPVVGLNFILTYFFTFSGFAVYLGFRRFYNVRDAVSFVWNRLARIYPVYVVTFLIGACLLYLEGSSATLSAVILNLTLVQSWFRSEDIFFFCNAVGWFVSTLSFLYIVFAVVLIRPERFFYGTAVLAFMSVALTTMYLENQTALTCNVIYRWFYVFPPNRLLVFVCGVATAMVFVRYYESLRNRLSTFTATVFELVALGLVLERILFRNIIDLVTSVVFTYVPSLPRTGYFLFDDYVSSVFLTNLLIFVFALEKGLLSWIFSVRIFMILGAISFSIFMSHQLVFRFISFYRDSLISAYGVIPTALGACVLALPIAYLLFIFVEKPGIHLLKKVRLDRLFPHG